jgi:hypothetical protein
LVGAVVEAEGDILLFSLAWVYESRELDSGCQEGRRETTNAQADFHYV